MSTDTTPNDVDVQSLQEHLTKALDCAEENSTRYHIREACQKVLILNEENK